MTPRQIALVQESIVPAVQALGRRHAGYGVRKHHYAVVEGALIWTLAVGLGEKFNHETEEAWRTAYRVLANTMQSNTEEKIHASQPATV
ncbi:MAG TPA: globin domain-containing protein [Burkholderiales bacterium]|nr:globin domain-containing protein [Burkholderiales bacterium]